MLIHSDIKSCIDETVATVVLLFEAEAFKLRQLPNCKFALHLFATTVVRRGKSPAPIRAWLNRHAGGVEDYVRGADVRARRARY